MSSSAMDSPLVGTARTEKVLWYQEVLSLDPDSRIFLPYARLLAELGRAGEATDVLKAGLAKHPEFLEARLLLIELLYTAGQENAAGLEADAIIELLSRSPALWRIWSRRPGLRADQAAMMLFFASAMQKGGLSLSDIFEAGISALEKGVSDNTETLPQTNDSPPADAIPAPVAPIAPVIPDEPSAPPVADESQPPAQAFVMTEDTTWYSLDAVPEDDDIYDDVPASPELPPVVLPLAAPVILPVPEPEAQPLPEQTESERVPAMSPVPRGPLEGKSSLCTRSMARVLEEQGATDEAADIYRELLENCATDEERRELNAKLANLLQGTDGIASAPQTSSSILDMLETLADRLEKRSRA